MSVLDAILKSPGRLTVGGAPEGYDALLIAEAARKRGGVTLHIARDDARAAAMLDALQFFAPSEPLARAVQAQVAQQLELLPRAEIVAQAFERNSGIVLTRDLDEACALADEYAPEHLCLAVRDPWAWAPRLTRAGGLFLGEQSFEVLGDYLAGPSHVMPTGGSARFASPLSVLDFVRLTSLIALDPATTREIIPHAARLAQAELGEAVPLVSGERDRSRRRVRRGLAVAEEVDAHGATVAASG